MNIIGFSCLLEGSLPTTIRQVLQQRANIEFILLAEKMQKYKINLKTRLPKSLADLKEAEIISDTEDRHVKRTFGNIMSAANAEISAIEDPLLMMVEDNVLTIQKTTILDPESTEFEMMFFYLQNHVIEFLRELLGSEFDLEKLRVVINEKEIEEYK